TARPVLGVVEWLDSERVASQQQRLVPRIEDGESEHAAKPADRVPTPAGISFQDDFSVAGRAESLTFFLQVATDLGEVVYLAVVGQHAPGHRVHHRLPRRLG